MTTALEGGEWSAARPGRTLPPGKTRCLFYRRLGGPQGRSGRADNLVPIGIRSRTVQPVAQSLYRLSYPAPYIYSHKLGCYVIMCQLFDLLLFLNPLSTASDSPQLTFPPAGLLLCSQLTIRHTAVTCNSILCHLDHRNRTPVYPVRFTRSLHIVPPSITNYSSIDNVSQ